METTPGAAQTNALAVRPANCTAIKTIFVPVSGSETDRVVLRATWEIAQSLQVHLEFLHLRLKLEEAAVQSPLAHCEGSGTWDALATLARDQGNLSTSAAAYVKHFCVEHGIAFNIIPSGAAGLSADCLEESGSPTRTLLFHARRCDFTVLGRPQHADCLPPTLSEDLLMDSGRPLLLVPKSLRHPLLGVVVVGWKESAASAKAVAAALPLLQVAQRVVIVNIAEDNSPGLNALEGVRQQLAWHGIHADVRRLGQGIARAETLLPEVVREMEAGLLVVGGYGHSRLRETFLGGVTSSLLKSADFPLLMVH